MNTIVKYNNQFNQIALRNFSSQELDLLISIASKVKEKGIEIIEVSLDGNSCVFDTHFSFVYIF